MQDKTTLRFELDGPLNATLLIEDVPTALDADKLTAIQSFVKKVSDVATKTAVPVSVIKGDTESTPVRASRRSTKDFSKEELEKYFKETEGLSPEERMHILRGLGKTINTKKSVHYSEWQMRKRLEKLRQEEV